MMGDAADAVFDERDVEVDEESKGFSGQLEVGGELGLVDGREFGDGFEFDDHQIVDEKIQTIAHVDDDSVVVNRLGLLPLHRESPLL